MSIQIFKNIFDEETYEEIVKYAIETLNHGGNNFTTNRHWQYEILKDSAPVMIHNMNHSSFLYLKMKKILESKTNMTVTKGNIMIYYWNRYSYIPWHNDYTYDGAITVYLNRHWHPDFGGYFLYTERKVFIDKDDFELENPPEDIRAIIPQKNLGVLQKDGIHHCTTPVNFSGDIRLTVQAFLENKK